MRPLTLKTPKIMLPLAGKPLLEYIVKLLRFHNITEVAINLSHLSEVVIGWLGDGSKFGVHITYSREDSVLGTAGALTRLRGFFDDTFVVIYGDVISDLDLSSLVEFHQAKSALASMALYEVEDPGRCGIVEIDNESRILRFVEKPAPGTTSSKLANAGIYVLEPEVIDYIPPETFYDFGYDLFPSLLSKGISLYGYVTTDTIIDAGIMENYRKVERELLEGRFCPRWLTSGYSEGFLSSL
ncbi:NDP-sugar synthase [Chloroflexota bacterium]